MKEIEEIILDARDKLGIYTEKDFNRIFKAFDNTVFCVDTGFDTDTLEGFSQNVFNAKGWDELYPSEQAWIFVNLFKKYQPDIGYELSDLFKEE